MCFFVATQLSWHFAFCFWDFRSLLSAIWHELWVAGAPPTCYCKTAAAESTKRGSVSEVKLIRPNKTEFMFGSDMIVQRTDDDWNEQKHVPLCCLFLRRPWLGKCDEAPVTWRIRYRNSAYFIHHSIPQAHSRCSIRFIECMSEIIQDLWREIQWDFFLSQKKPGNVHTSKLVHDICVFTNVILYEYLSYGVPLMAQWKQI